MKKLFFILALSLMFSGNVLKAEDDDPKKTANTQLENLFNSIESGVTKFVIGGKRLIFNRYTAIIAISTGATIKYFDLYNHPEQICEILVWAQENSPDLVLPLTNLIAENPWLKEYLCKCTLE